MRRRTGGLRTQPAANAAPTDRLLDIEQKDKIDRSSLPPRPAEANPSMKYFSDKGYSVVSADKADELNAYLRQNKSNNTTTKASKAARVTVKERTYIVNFVKGMSAKMIGNLTLPTRVSEKEVKDGALDMVIKGVFVKCEKDVKGVSLSKNIVTVRA